MRLLFVFDEECFAPGATVTNFGPASLFTGGDPVTYFGASPVSFFPQQNGGLRQSKASGWVQQVPGCGSSGISRHEVQEQVYGIFQQRFDMKVPKKVPSRFQGGFAEGMFGKDLHE